jgi:hypothetical protein
MKDGSISAKQELNQYLQKENVYLNVKVLVLGFLL